jgi:transmembrane sensor
MHDSLQIEEIAAGWLARRDGEGWSAIDQIALTAWLGASTAHRVAYIRLEAAWQRARRLKVLAAYVLADEVPQSGKRTVISRTVEDYFACAAITSRE